MLSLNTASDCRAQFLCRETSSFITCCTRAFSRQKTRGGISLPVAFKRLSCSPIIILNKQTICLLSISPCRSLHLNFPPLLQHTLVLLLWPAQHKHSKAQNTRMQLPPAPQTNIYTCLLSLPDTPVSKTVILCLLVLVAKASKNCSRVIEFCKKQYFHSFCLQTAGH